MRKKRKKNTTDQVHNTHRIVASSTVARLAVVAIASVITVFVAVGVGREGCGLVSPAWGENFIKRRLKSQSPLDPLIDFCLQNRFHS